MISYIQFQYISKFFEAQKNAIDFEDNELIMDFYVREILDSDLSNINKKALLAGFSVYIQSVYYWANYELND